MVSSFPTRSALSLSYLGKWLLPLKVQAQEGSAGQEKMLGGGKTC